MENRRNASAGGGGSLDKFITRSNSPKEREAEAAVLEEIFFEGKVRKWFGSGHTHKHIDELIFEEITEFSQNHAERGHDCKEIESHNLGKRTRKVDTNECGHLRHRKCSKKKKAREEKREDSEQIKEPKKPEFTHCLFTASLPTDQLDGTTESEKGALIKNESCSDVLRLFSKGEQNGKSCSVPTLLKNQESLMVEKELFKPLLLIDLEETEEEKEKDNRVIVDRAEDFPIQQLPSLSAVAIASLVINEVEFEIPQLRSQLISQLSNQAFVERLFDFEEGLPNHSEPCIVQSLHCKEAKKQTQRVSQSSSTPPPSSQVHETAISPRSGRKDEALQKLMRENDEFRRIVRHLSAKVQQLTLMVRQQGCCDSEESCK